MPCRTTVYHSFTLGIPYEAFKCRRCISYQDVLFLKLILMSTGSIAHDRFPSRLPRQWMCAGSPRVLTFLIKSAKSCESRKDCAVKAQSDADHCGQEWLFVQMLSLWFSCSLLRSAEHTHSIYSPSFCDVFVLAPCPHHISENQKSPGCGYRFKPCTSASSLSLGTGTSKSAVI